MEFEAPETRNLLDQARSGDAEAFSEICRAYETRLLRRAMTLCGNATKAEELAQDTLVEGWKSLRRYNGRCQFFTWLCAILLNRYRNTVRKKCSVLVSVLKGPDPNEFQDSVANPPDSHPMPDEAAQIREEADIIWESVQALSGKQQQVIYLRFYVDDSLEGIASALGCSVGTVKSRLFHALDKLRAMNAIKTQFPKYGAKG